MSDRLLVSLRLEGRRALVVGGGPVGRRKTARLLLAGAEVRLIAPVDSELSVWVEAQRGLLAWRQRLYEPGDLDACQIVFACTDDPNVNLRVASDARSMGLWCNVADKSVDGDFDLLATLRLGGICVGTSSRGAAPAVSKLLREHLQGLLGPEWAELVGLVSDVRTSLRTEVGSSEERAARIRGLLGRPLLRAMAQGSRDITSWVEQEAGTRLDPVRTEAGARPTVIISGFGPFPGVPLNPTLAVAEAAGELLEARHPGVRVVTAELPTRFDAFWEVLCPIIEAVEEDPKSQLMGIFPLGVDVRSEAVCLERVAINHRVGARPDASGRSVQDPDGEPIVVGGPGALLARSPVDRLARELKAQGMRVEVSNSAGTYLCNESFYRVLRWCNQVGFVGRACFMHIPMVPGPLPMQEVAEIVAAVCQQAIEP